MYRGEIYVVDLGPGVGREVSGVSPVVVVSNDVNNSAPLFITVLPAVDVADIRATLGLLVTSADCGHPTDIAILSQQPRTLDASRFTHPPTGTVPLAIMALLGYALKVHLDIT